MISFLSINNLIIILIIIFLIIIVWLISIQVKLKKIIKKNQEIFSGTNARNLEEALYFYSSEVKKVKSDIKEIKKFCNHLNIMSEKSIQKIGLIRFNPFSDTGGNQSFAIALLDYYNNGLVISSLHGRQGTRIYAKPVLAGKSKYNLSTEEIKAIEKATEIKTK